MASIRKRKYKTKPPTFQVQIRRVGSSPIAKSFLTREDAIKWARKTEREQKENREKDKGRERERRESR